MFRISERDLFWLAGYLEGEGCFSLRNRTTGVQCISIIAQTTDNDVALKVSRIMRCTATREVRDPRGHRKPAWICCLGRRKDVTELLRLLLPLMGERRSAKIRELLRADENYHPMSVAEHCALMRSRRDPDKFRAYCQNRRMLNGRWVPKDVKEAEMVTRAPHLFPLKSDA